MAELPFSDVSWQRHLDEGRLMGSRCRACGQLSVPPRALCPACRGAEMAWEEMAGQGNLVSFTCIAVPPPALRLEGYGRGNPYCVGVVELSEGPRVVARIEGLDFNRPEEIKLGQPLAARFLRRPGQDEGKTAETILGFGPA